MYLQHLYNLLFAERSWFLDPLPWKSNTFLNIPKTSPLNFVHSMWNPVHINLLRCDIRSTAPVLHTLIDHKRAQNEVFSMYQTGCSLCKPVNICSASICLARHCLQALEVRLQNAEEDLVKLFFHEDCERKQNHFWYQKSLHFLKKHLIKEGKK